MSVREVVACANEDHRRRTRAVAKVSWPNGPYKPTTACVGCLAWTVDTAITEGNTVLVEPIPPDVTPCTTADLIARGGQS